MTDSEREQRAREWYQEHAREFIDSDGLVHMSKVLAAYGAECERRGMERAAQWIDEIGDKARDDYMSVAYREDVYRHVAAAIRAERQKETQ